MSLSKRGVYLKNLIENQGSERAVDVISEILSTGKMKPDDFSIREIAEATMGEAWLGRIERESSSRGGVQLLEDTAGVDSTAFANITGQIIYNKVLEGYNSPLLVGDRLVTVIPTTFHDGEKLAGVTEPLGDASTVDEGMPFPEMAMQENYIQTPATVKQGNIVSLTKEAIAKDRTGMIMQQARAIGERVGVKREHKILDVVLGVTNNYKWKGTTYNTFLTSGGWINDKSSSELLDWTSIDDVMIQLSEITNPFQLDSNEPLPVILRDLLVMPSKETTARRMLTATETRAVSNTNNTTIGGNPVPQLSLSVSALAYQRLVKSGISTTNAKQYWFAGDFKRAFAYMQVYPLTVTQAAPNGDAEFERDIVARFKAAERGVAVVTDPRAVARRYVS